MSQGVAPRNESTHHRLYEFAKTALIRIFVHPYVTVCDLYCGSGVDAEKWNEAQITHYIGIDVSQSGIGQVREAWESQKKAYTAEFFEVDPCKGWELSQLDEKISQLHQLRYVDCAFDLKENIETHLQEKTNSADLVCCLQHLQMCFETEERARKLLHNVSALLKPGGYFFGITPDSSTIWAKYQKNVEAYHNRGSSMKLNIVPNCIRSESYMITFEVEEEKFPLFGKKYQLKFASDISAETHCLVHFPSFIRLAREAGLEYIEIQNLTEFYDDNRAQFAGMLVSCVQNLVDPRGRLLPRSYDVLGLYSTFIFQKPDPDITPPPTTPLPTDVNYHHDEREWSGSGRRDEDRNGQTEVGLSLGKISEQKGILGPGPADLRFSEAL